MKNLVNMLLFALASFVTLPALANPPSTPHPQSPADCQKSHAGDDAKIQACIDGLKK